MKNVNLFFMTLATIMIVACQNDGIFTELHEKQNVVATKLKKEYTTEVNEKTALYVAETFDYGNTTRSVKTIKELKTINDTNGYPLFYIVNYADDQGFILISATKNYYPVLAYNNEGNFELNENTPISLLSWIEETKASIEFSQSQPIDSSSIYRSMWSKYNKINFTGPQTRSENSGIQATTYINQWRAEGYECYDLSDAIAAELPSDVYTRFLANAENSIFPLYNYEEYAIVRVKETDNSHSIENLFTNTWHRYSPYNADIIPAGNASYGTIAAAQIMRYHEYPTHYDYDNMPTDASSSEVTEFIAHIETALERFAVSGVNREDAYCIKNALDTTFLYSSSMRVVPHDISYISAQLYNNRPMIMTGTNSSGTKHAWVASGYRRFLGTRDYELMVPVSEYEYSCIDSYSYLTMESFYTYCNWGGVSGKSNGYFSESTIPFKNSRYDIINITPMNN